MTEVSNSRTRPDVLGNRGVPGWTDPDALSRVVAASMRLTQRLARRQLLDTPVIDRSDAPWVDAVEAAHADIAAEWAELRSRRERLPTIDELIGLDVGREGTWSTYGLLDGEGWFDGAPTEMAATAAVLGSIPGLQQASFSVLAPGSEVVAHRGPNPGVIRALLGVAVPEPDSCGILVGSVTLQPRAGSCLLFDDTFEHIAWNDGSQERVMLMLEVRRRFRGPARASNAVSQALYRRYPQARRARRRYLELLDQPA